MKKLLGLSLFLILSVIANGQNSYVPTAPKSATIELTRMANTSAYAALDAISNDTAGLVSPIILSFTSVASPKNSNSPLPALGYITKALIATNQSACVARFRLHLFTGTLTAIVDNAPFTALYTSLSKKIGYIDFSACSTDGSGSTMATSITYTSIPFRLPASSTTVYAFLETLDVFTPASGQKFFIQLIFDSN